MWGRFSLVVLAALLAGCRSDRQARPVAARPAVRAPHRYAVLLNGDTERRHKDNVRLAYGTLRTLGFDPARVFVLSPRDRKRGQLPVLVPKPDNFWRVMDDLTETVLPGDQVLVYGTGHGDTEKGESLLELRRGELWAADLREEVDHFRGDTVVMMDQCFSGGFIDAFKPVKTRALVLASVDAKHETDCSAFATGFWNAFLHPETNDRNHDGKVSVREAYAVADKAHRENLAGDPELKATPACVSFNGLEDALLN